MDRLEGFVVIGGYDGSNFLNDCEVYSEDQVSIPPLPLPLNTPIAERVEATGAIIVAGGRTIDGSNTTSDRTFLLPTLTSSEWQEVGRMVQPVSLASSILYKQFVLVLGGLDSSAIDTIQCLDTSQATPSWTSLKNKLPRALYGHQSVLFKDTIVIVTCEGGTYTCSVNQLVNDTGEVDWTPGQLPGVKGSVGVPGLGVFNDSLVVVHGRDVLTKSSPGSDSEWSPLPQLPQSKTSWPSVANNNYKLVVAGGYSDGTTSSVYELNTGTNKWEEATPLKKPRCNHATVQCSAYS